MYGKLIAAWIFMADTILFLYKQKTTIQTLALQPDVWGTSCPVLLPSPCNGSACTYHSALFVKPQQWPTPSESIAIYCVRKLVSCYTSSVLRKSRHMKQKKKLRTVAKIKTQDYKILRLQNFVAYVFIKRCYACSTVIRIAYCRDGQSIWLKATLSVTSVPEWIALSSMGQLPFTYGPFYKTW